MKTKDVFAEKILHAYADLDGLTDKECAAAGLKKDQCAALGSVLSDEAKDRGGFISEKERGFLKYKGFSDNFVYALAGRFGTRAIEARVSYLNRVIPNSDLPSKASIEAIEIVDAIQFRTGIYTSETAWALVDAMKDNDENVSAEAAKVFHRCPKKILRSDARKFTDAMIELLGSGSETVRLFSAYALREIGPAAKKAIPALLKTMIDDGSRWVRQDSAKALGSIGKPAFPGLLKVVSLENGYDADTRVFAVQALIHMGLKSKRTVPTLVDVIKTDPSSEVRKLAVMALGDIGPSAASVSVPILIYALKDKERNVRWQAADALEDLGHAARDAVPELIEAFNNDERVRARAAGALGAMGPAAKGALPHLRKFKKENPYNDDLLRIIDGAINRIDVGGVVLLDIEI